MNKEWEYYDIQEDLVENISKKFNISKLLATVLANRGVINEESIKTFLSPTRNDFHNPFLLPDMEKAVERIMRAINNNEKTIIYGDYDVDGITSITVLKKFLEERGLITGHHIPNRLEEGYGLNKQTIEQIKKDGYTLMITVDCGISGIEEVELGNSYGIDTIITDHHEQGEILPNAYAVVDAKRKDNKYPFRELAGVGIVFKLIQALSIKMNLDDKEYLKYLDIVCVGTISDIVPLIDENRVIAKLGLMLVKITKNVGLRELIIDSGYKEVNSTTISFGVAPRINACGRMGFQEKALDLFLTKDINEAKQITKELNIYNLQRQEKEKEIFNEALRELEKENIDKLNSIVLKGENWHHGVIGIVASRITEKFYKPTILIGFEEEEGKGSGRSIQGFDLHNALAELNEYLAKFGGHEMAIGLSMKKKNFYKFKEEFEKLAQKEKVNEIVPKIKIDSKITFRDINQKTIDELKELEPFGEKNKKPLFTYNNLKIDSIRTLSEGKHIKLTLKDENLFINAIGFNLGNLAENFLIGDKVDVVGNLEENSFNGNKIIQINLKDIRKAI